MDLEILSQSIRIERTRQQAVDGHVAGDGLACQSGDEAGQASASAIGKAEDIDGRFDRA